MTDAFYGRKQYFDILHKRVSGLKDGYRQNVAFIGDELVGKSFILRAFLGSLCDSRLVTAYVEVRQETFASFCRRFIGILLYDFLRPSPEDIREDLDFLIEKASPEIPLTVGSVKELLADLKKRRYDNIFTRLLSLTEQLHAESGRFCVVVFDEFQNLERMGIKKLYKEWSQLLLVQKNTMYIIASSSEWKAMTILSRDLSLLFGNFEIVHVEPFEPRTGERFLESRLKGSAFSTGERKFATHLAGGCPYYLKLLAERVSGRACSLCEALEDLLLEPAGALNQRFSSGMKRFEEMPCGPELVSILCNVAAGCNKVKDIAHVTRKLSREVASRVNYLVENDIVRRSGDFLIIKDRMFGFWLRLVYRERLASLTHESANLQRSFRDGVGKTLLEFVQQSGKPVPQRMAELFRLFSDERIQVERKNVRLERFREIKPLEFGSKRLKEGLICRSSDSVWILAFGSGSITEEDVADFAKECKKYRNKMTRKIIVDFSGLDHGSHLKALEEKIVTWDLNRVNQILDLYSRPGIIT